MTKRYERNLHSLQGSGQQAMRGRSKALQVKRQKTARGIYIVLRDFLLICVALVIFALFHHVLPRNGGGPKRSIVDIPTKNAAAAPTPNRDVPGQGTKTDPAPADSPAESGDFSAAFPKADTGAGALHSYQSDTLRIAVRQVQKNEMTYYVADVWMKNINAFRTAFAHDQYGQGIHQDPTAMAADNHAILAVTGDYYGARAKGIVIRNGELYRDTLFSDVCVLFADGSMETYPKSEFNMDNAMERKAYQAWSFGPRLLDNGQQIEAFTDAVKGKNPRCSIGYYEPGHYCLVVVDGRQPGYSVGMTLAELSEVFYELGCKAAYNLDGGQTAMMLFRGEPVNRAYKGGRQCSDIIYMGE